MAEPNPAPAGAEVTSTPEPKQPASVLDFEPSAPAGAEPAPKQEAGEDEALVALAGETEAEAPAQQDDDDRETTLRDGKKVTYRELKRGYLPDFENKVREFETRAKAFHQQTMGFNAVQQQTAQLLNQLVEYAQQRMPKAPDSKLLETDPFEYQRQKAHYDEERGKLGELAARRQAFFQQARQQQAQAWHKRTLEQREAILAAMPELKDRVKAAKFTEDVRALGAELGYTPAELNEINDARLVRLIAMALKSKQHEAALSRIREKQKEAQKPPEVTPPTQRRRTQGQIEADTHRARMQRLAKSPGSTKAAEDVLSQFP